MSQPNTEEKVPPPAETETKEEQKLEETEQSAPPCPTQETPEKPQAWGEVVEKRCPPSPIAENNPDIKSVLLSEAAILARCTELADQISHDLKDVADEGQVILIGVLKGAYMFLSDLARRLRIPHWVDFVAVSSYGKGAKSGEVRVVMDCREPLFDKHVIIVEDIIDSGKTLEFLVGFIKARKPKSIKTVALIKKKKPVPPHIEADYLGFTLPDVWLVGYGLDYAERYRTLPHVAELHDAVWKK